MTKAPPRPRSRVIIIAVSVWILCAAAVLGLVYCYMAYHERKVMNDANIKINASLEYNYALLSPQLEKFGLRLAKPGKSTCTDGDPSLYKYSCGASAGINKDDEPTTLVNGENAAHVLMDFDAFMRKNDYATIGNDFRRMRMYDGKSWATDISSGGITVEYLSKKDSCSVSFHVSVSRPSYNQFSGLYCGTTLFPVTDD